MPNPNLAKGSKHPKRFSDAGIDAESATIIAAMSPTPSDARQTLIDTLVTGLRSDLGAASLGAVFDTFYVMAADAEANALINWATPGTYNLTAVNSPTFTTDRGFTGNGTTQYLNTNYIPSTNGVRYVLNSASFGVYSRTNSNAVMDDGGATNSTNLVLNLRCRSGGNVIGRANTATATTVANADSLGLHVQDRAAVSGAGARRVLKNGVELGTATTTSTAVPDVAVFILALNDQGTPANHSTRQIAFSFLGKSFSGAHHLAIFTRIEAFLDAIGAGVV